MGCCRARAGSTSSLLSPQSESESEPDFSTEPHRIDSGATPQHAHPREAQRGACGLHRTYVPMKLASLSAVATCLALLAVGCGGSSVKGPTAPAAHPNGGSADDNTWMTLSSHGARMRVPEGWTYRAEGTELRAEPSDHRAALILDGATSKQEFEAKMRALGQRYGLDRVDFSRGKPGNLNGIQIVAFEDQAAESKGDQGDVFVMLGEAPNGKGILFLFLWASDRTQKYDEQMIQAANTLRPI